MLMFLYTVHGLLVTTVSACVSGPLVLIPQTDSTCELARGAMQEIGSVENIPKYLEKAKDKADPFKLMGFGHRVYVLRPSSTVTSK